MHNGIQLLTKVTQNSMKMVSSPFSILIPAFIMKYALLSDIHSNLEAFQAVIKDLECEKVDHICFLGDIVGYGADPGKCIDLLENLTPRVVAGNHDWAAVGLTDTTYFNPAAKSAVDWTSEKISPSHRKFLKNLPLTHLLPPPYSWFTQHPASRKHGITFFLLRRRWRVLLIVNSRSVL